MVFLSFQFWKELWRFKTKNPRILLRQQNFKKTKWNRKCTVYLLNTLSEYTYIYMSKNITSYIFLLVFKIVESLQCILKKELRIFIQFLKSFVQFRGSVHTQTATLNVKLTFVDVWVKMSDIRAVAKMSKTNFQNTMCNNSNTK